MFAQAAAAVVSTQFGVVYSRALVTILSSAALLVAPARIAAVADAAGAAAAAVVAVHVVASDARYDAADAASAVAVAAVCIISAVVVAVACVVRPWLDHIHLASHFPS